VRTLQPDKPEGFLLLGEKRTERERMSTLRGAEAIMKALEREGVEVIFGVPGGATLPLYDALFDSPIRHILTRHEQGAGHMAEGYAKATGRVGVAFATSGPGSTNLVTPLQDALMDSVPVVAITGQVARASIGNDAFQEADTSGIAMHCTKHAYLVTDPEELVDTVHEAFFLAASGRPGPVLVDVPKDVQNTEISWHKTKNVDLPGFRPTQKGHPLQVRRAVELLKESERPVLYAGGGVIKAGAHAELLRLAEKANAPVVTTLMARGAFPDDHPLALGMPGMHGTYSATTSMQKADLLVALGARFDDRVTGDPDRFAPAAKVIHIDIDPAEISKIRQADVPIVGDVRMVLQQMLDEIDKKEVAISSHEDWLETLKGWQLEYPLHYEQPADGAIKPQYVIDRFWVATGGDAVVVSGVGQHQMWVSQFWKYSRPRSLITSGGLGTMGFGLPAAIGAKVGRPDETVIAFDGDGSLQMTCQELITASTHDIPVKVAVINNTSLGMVRQWQKLFHGQRYSATSLSDQTPDFVKLAEAMGCVGLRATAPGEVDGVIEKALSISDRPVVIEFRVDPDESVFPMVPGGASNDEIAMGPEDLR
jgi:acetolactate synthase-1/2/3 large subunit